MSDLIKAQNPLSAHGEVLGISKRRRKELRFRLYGILAITFALGFLALLIFSIIRSGYTAFQETRIRLPVTFSLDVVNPYGEPLSQAIEEANYLKLVQNSLKTHFPEVEKKGELFRLYGLVSMDAALSLKQMLKADHDLVGKTVEVWLKASSPADMYAKGRISAKTPQEFRILDNNQLKWLFFLESENRVQKFFNTTFFTRGDSRSPERSGILSSAVGSIFTIFCCMMVAFPLGLMTAVYLEEFAPKNFLTEIIEVNINNLAAVPSIIFGLLGLAVYINVFGLPRSSSLVGGLTLALLILPIIVIATRNSLRSVPQSVKDAATALGASKMQVTLHHAVPLAMPGIITGTILGVARAMGETAPLLMIGMVAFIADVPRNILSPATALPVQVYLWSSSPEMGFAERTSAAILILIAFLATVNAGAIFLRKKFEVKWS